MSHFSNFNDGSQNPPRLRIGQALWGLDKLPMNAPIEWSIAEKVRKVKEAGYEHLECFHLDNEPGARVREELRQNGLYLTLGHRPMNVAQTRQLVELGVKWGAQWVVCQPATAFHSLEEIVAIVTEGAKIAADNGLNYFVETHRNNFTESIPQTLRLIEAVPDIAITADFSHFVLCGEFYGWESEGAIGRLQPIIERVAHVHGRVSNGEQVQVDVGDGSGVEGEPAHFFRQIWKEIFRTWRRTAQPGDVLPFTPELGPPRYAITLPDGSEFSDRWEQALVIRQMAMEMWEEF